MTKTTATKKEDIVTHWHYIDAKGKVLGSLATHISKLLMGKNKPYYTDTMPMGDKVVITNAGKVAVTGQKKIKKTYNWYTGYPGGIKEESLGSLMARRPTEALRRAVFGMLPKNKLRKHRIKNLYIYEGDTHPHTQK